MNPQRYGDRILVLSSDPYFIMREEQLQLYLQQFRDIDVQNRHTFILEDGLYIGRKGLGPIATKFNKVIIGFITGKYTTKKVLTRRVAIYFPNSRHHFYIGETTFNNLNDIMIMLMMKIVQIKLVYHHYGKALHIIISL
jgi:hypothetical protein